MAYLNYKGQTEHKLTLYYPVTNPRQTQGYHSDHRAVDWVNDDFGIYAPGYSKVIDVGWQVPGGGNYVILESLWYVRPKVYYVFCHFGKYKGDGIYVKVGDILQAGEPIGIMGNTGTVHASAGGTGIHLHFAIRLNVCNRDGTTIDPLGDQVSWKQCQPKPKKKV